MVLGGEHHPETEQDGQQQAPPLRVDCTGDGWSLTTSHGSAACAVGSNWGSSTAPRGSVWVWTAGGVERACGLARRGCQIP